MSTESQYTKAQELQAEGKHEEAASIYKGLVAHSEDPRYYIAYGVCLQQLRRWQESVKQLKRGIELKPHYCEGDARLFLAESLVQLGLNKKAIEQWKLVAAMEPEYPSYEAVQNEAKRKLGEHAA